MEKIEFKDLPDTTTPLSANNLNDLQDNIEDAINLVSDYSTIETVVGTYNNKPLYRKTFTGSYSNNNVLVSNVAVLVNCQGTAIISGIGRCLPYYEIYNNNIYIGTVIVQNNQIIIKLEEAGSWVTTNIDLTLEYTKTTD